MARGEGSCPKSCERGEVRGLRRGLGNEGERELSEEVRTEAGRDGVRVLRRGLEREGEREGVVSGFERGESDGVVNEVKLRGDGEVVVVVVIGVDKEGEREVKVEIKGTAVLVVVGRDGEIFGVNDVMRGDKRGFTGVVVVVVVVGVVDDKTEEEPVVVKETFNDVEAKEGDKIELIKFDGIETGVKFVGVADVDEVVVVVVFTVAVVIDVKSGCAIVEARDKVELLF